MLREIAHVIAVKFSEQEKLEYSKMEATALAAYVNLKGNGDRIGKHQIYLMSKLTPLRTACAGGKVPLDDFKENSKPDTNTYGATDSENDSNENEPKFSHFAFTSKLNALISKLENIRERDETGTYFFVVFRHYPVCLSSQHHVLLPLQPNALCFPNSRRH